MEMKKAVGLVLRDLRTEQKRTLSDVSSSVPMALSYLSQVECGYKEVSSSVLHNLCFALRVPTHQVVIEAGYRMGGLPNEMPTHEMVAPIREFV
jgi:transcriptional regulator with XRE-family HTH domain